MEASPGPLRSPDGLWWWDGKGWQPIATLATQAATADIWHAPPDVAPPPAQPLPPAEDPPLAGTWQPPPATGQQPSGAWQPPGGMAEQPTVAPPSPPAPVSPLPLADLQPTEEVSSWQSPAASEPAPAAALDPTADAVWQPPADPVPMRETAPGAAPEPITDVAWQPPPAPGQAPAPAPLDPVPAGQTPQRIGEPVRAAALEPTRAAPPPAPAAPPPPPAAAEPAKADVPWPNWLPRNERSEAVVEDVPTRVDPGAVKPAAAPRPGTAPIQVSSEARSSSWVSQLYPAGTALNQNRRLVTYVGLGILGLIALYVLFQALSGLNLFGSGGSGSAVDTGPSGTQFQQADGFLTHSLNPALISITTAAKPITVDCGGTHSVTCRNTLDNTDTAVVKAIAVIDKGPFPGCMAASVVQARRDLIYLDQALKTAAIGFRYNSDDLISRGLIDFKAASPTLKTDGDALKAASQSACPKTP